MEQLDKQDKLNYVYPQLFDIIGANKNDGVPVFFSVGGGE